MASKYVIELSEAEERDLRQRAAQYTRSYREVVRAKIVLLAAEGHANVEIARRLDCHREVGGPVATTILRGRYSRTR